MDMGNWIKENGLLDAVYAVSGKNITVLVNNVAVLQKSMFAKMPWEKIEGTMNVNMDSML